MHFDIAINDGDNFYYPDDVPRSNALADALHDASDHLPVAVDYVVSCPADLDLDGEVGIVDFLTLLGLWGTDRQAPYRQWLSLLTAVGRRKSPPCFLAYQIGFC